MPTKIEWSQVADWSGYKVSSIGQVYSLKSNKILKPMTAKSGHLYVYLYDGSGFSKKVYIHQIVLRSFGFYSKENEECRHLNGNPKDNRLENLQWGTRQENVDDRRRHGRMPIPHKSKFTKLSQDDIPIIRRMKSKKSSRFVANIFKTSHTTIQKIWRNERWKGY